MKAKILSMKPPKKYKEGCFFYEDGLDVIPELLDYIQHGFTMEEARKMDLLVRIECQKYHLGETLKEYPNAINEIKESEEYIKELINEYNGM